MQRECGLPVFIDNDANCAALGEMWKGSGNGARDLIFVTLGTGVGGGVIVGGKLVRGVNGAAGEIGHITSVPEGGYPCNCGKNGCLETIASARESSGWPPKNAKYMQRTGKENLLPELFSAKDVFDSARSGDPFVSLSWMKSLYIWAWHWQIWAMFLIRKKSLSGEEFPQREKFFNPCKNVFRKFAFLSVKIPRSSLLLPSGMTPGSSAPPFLSGAERQPVPSGKEINSDFLIIGKEFLI